MAAELEMEGACTGLAEKPLAELTREMKLSSNQLYDLLVNTVRRKVLTLVASAEKHHGLAAWKRIKTEYQPDAAGSRGAANTLSGGVGTTNPRIRR